MYMNLYSYAIKLFKISVVRHKGLNALLREVLRVFINS